MGRVDPKRLAKLAAGRPAALKESTLVGEGTVVIPFAEAHPRDGLVAVLDAGDNFKNIVDTSNLHRGAGGTTVLNPGADVSTHHLLVFWYDFDDPFKST